MAILKIANVHFTQSGNNRLEYSGNGVVKLHSEALRLPVGTTAAADEAGLIRYNSAGNNFEGSNGTHWFIFESQAISDVKSDQVGGGANTFATNTIAGANTAVGAGANAFTTAANTFLQNTIAGANTAVGTGANTFLLATIAGANTTVGTGANTFLLRTLDGANTLLRNTIAGANTEVGTGANTFLLRTLDGANTAVGTGANTFLLRTLDGANTAVGQGSNAFTTAANTFLRNTIAGANTAVGAGANAFTTAANTFLSGLISNRVSSVTGTSGRITVTSGNTPVVDLAVAGVGTPTTYTSGISAIAVDAYGRVTGVTDSAGYVPSNGTGATGTWNISITGNAKNITDSANTISGYGNFYVGSVNTQQVLQNWGWNNSVARWKPVIENDAGFALYSYDSAGGTSTQRMYINNSTGATTFTSSLRTTSLGVGTAPSGTTGEISASEITATTRVSSPQFRNSSDTNARFEADKVVMRGGSPTMYFRDTDGNSAMLYNNGNLFYLLRGAADTETWTQVSSQWPAIFDLTNNNCTIGGSLTAISNITAYASDKRLKENIVEIPNAIEKIKQIRGVTFDWNYDEEKIGFRPQTKTNDIGCIAQEVQEVLPHVVTLAPFDTWQPDPNEKYSEEELESKKGTSKSGENYLTIQYERMVPLLIQAIKEQQEQIESLKTEIDELKKGK